MTLETLEFWFEPCELIPVRLESNTENADTGLVGWFAVQAI